MQPQSALKSCPKSESLFSEKEGSIVLDSRYCENCNKFTPVCELLAYNGFCEDCRMGHLPARLIRKRGGKHRGNNRWVQAQPSDY